MNERLIVFSEPSPERDIVLVPFARERDYRLSIAALSTMGRVVLAERPEPPRLEPIESWKIKVPITEDRPKFTPPAGWDRKRRRR